MVRLYQAGEAVVSQLYDRYSFPKLMVTDPQDDWPAAFKRNQVICLRTMGHRVRVYASSA